MGSMTSKKLKRTFAVSEVCALVWTFPMSTLSKAFEVSDVALRKRLSVTGIPLPGADHWAKVREHRFIEYPELGTVKLAEKYDIAVPVGFDLTPLLSQREYRSALDSILNYKAPTRITRAQLHRLLWGYRLGELESVLAISGRVIKAICAKHAISGPRHQNSASRARGAGRRIKRLAGNQEKVVLTASGDLDLASLLAKAPAAEEGLLEPAPCGAYASHLIHEWIERRRDKRAVSREGVEHGLHHLGHSDSDSAALGEFLATFPPSPATSIRRSLKNSVTSETVLAEIMSSLMSLAEFYSWSSIETSKAADADAAENDAPSRARQREISLTLLNWFERHAEDGDWRFARDHGMFALMLYAGLSVAEVLSARLPGLDLFGGTLTYHGRSEVTRCTLPTEVILPLWRYGSHKPAGKSDALFINMNSEVLTRQGVHRILKDRLEEAGMTPSHQLRYLSQSYQQEPYPSNFT